MTGKDGLQLAVLAILLACSAYFSSAETALTTVNKVRIRMLADEGDRRAQTLLKVLEDPARMLGAILVGNNIVNISASSLATTLAIRFFGSRAVGIVTGVITLLVLVFGEITPKTAASVRAQEIALGDARTIWILMHALRPVIVIVEGLSGLVLRVMGIRKDEEPAPMTEKELRTIVSDSRSEGVIEREEQQMIYNVFDFGDSTAKDVMVPRADMVCVEENAGTEEIAQVFRQEKYTRLPVYREDKINIVGIIHIKDFFLSENREGKRAADFMYEPYFTYENKKTSELMMEMRENSIPLSIVLDDYSAAVGMVTLEDLLEELVGEIRDEYDQDEEDLIRRAGPGEFLIEGSVKLDDINDELGLSLSCEDYDSIGGYLIGLLDRLPAQGERVAAPEGVILRAEKVDRTRVVTVRLTLPKAEKENSRES